MTHQYVVRSMLNTWYTTGKSALQHVQARVNFIQTNEGEILV